MKSYQLVMTPLIDVWIFTWMKKVIHEELHNINAISYGFTERMIIRNFPIRGKRVYLHLRHRKWLNKVTDQIITRKIDLTYNETYLTKDFIVIFKKSYKLSQVLQV